MYSAFQVRKMTVDNLIIMHYNYIRQEIWESELRS